MRKLIITAISVCVLNGCSSAPKSTLPEAMPDKVLSRINEMSSRPDWLNESKPFDIKDGSVLSLGQTTIPGSDRVEAAYAIADNNAKGAICSAIESRLEVIFQNAEEGTAIDSTQARRISAEACKITTSSIRPGNRYWEKVAMSTDSGERMTRYKVFATVTMPEAEFKRAVMNAIRKAEGKGGLSQDFAKTVDNHWDSFVKGEK